MMEIKKEIYLIRHGETEYNRMGIVQGSGIDAPLNNLGQTQAQAFFKTYGHLKFDKIYTSLLQRAYQSIEPFVQAGVQVERYEGLNEISWGSFEQRKMNAFDKSYYYELINSWQSGDITRPIENGESPVDVAKRQQPVIDLILSREDEKKVLICMHGRAMRVLLCTIMGKPLTEMESFQHHNLGLYHLVLREDGGIEALKENCIRHLED